MMRHFKKLFSSSKTINTGDVALCQRDEDTDLASVYAVDTNGYCVSLSRFPGDTKIEVMVADQINYKTNEVKAHLYSDKLVVCLSKHDAKELDNITEYVILLEVNAERLQEIDTTLKIIFAGLEGYEARFGGALG
jgi:hypothetical protein